jgi:hypothetical protein
MSIHLYTLLITACDWLWGNFSFNIFLTGGIVKETIVFWMPVHDQQEEHDTVTAFLWQTHTHPTILMPLSGQANSQCIFLRMARSKYTVICQIKLCSMSEQGLCLNKQACSYFVCSTVYCNFMFIILIPPLVMRVTADYAMTFLVIEFPARSRIIESLRRCCHLWNILCNTQYPSIFFRCKMGEWHEMFR